MNFKVELFVRQNELVLKTLFFTFKKLLYCKIASFSCCLLLFVSFWRTIRFPSTCTDYLHIYIHNIFASRARKKMCADLSWLYCVPFINHKDDKFLGRKVCDKNSKMRTLQHHDHGWKFRYYTLALCIYKIRLCFYHHQVCYFKR